MIAGLTWTAWLLMAAAVIPGLLMAIAFYIAHRRDVTGHDHPRNDPGDPT